MLDVHKVSFSYAKNEVLTNISFQAKKGSYIAIIGESGCGKSTLLEIIYGLLHIDKGVVSWNDTKLLGPNFYLVPGEPFMKYLSQDFDLMPFTTAAENIGKFLPNRFPKEKKRRTAELLELVDLVAFADVKVKHLSGGQKQRVALARVLAKEPELLLLDEPFSHIDNFRKNKLRRKLFKYLKEKNIGCIVATHDSTDALSFADHILVMKDGQIIAQNPPEQLYNNPDSYYVASFFGDVNELNVSDILSNSDSKERVICYPHEIRITENSELKATVIKSYFKEGHFLIEMEFQGQTIFVQHDQSIGMDTVVALEFSKKLIQRRINTSNEI